MEDARAGSGAPCRTIENGPIDRPHARMHEFEDAGFAFDLSIGW